MLTMKQAKQIVIEAHNAWIGFECSLPEDLLFCFAGNVRHNGWTQSKLFEAFELHFTIQK